ncbi:MAG: phosphoenolpyruvate--protein phosphotransferase [Candidatus Omnitrophota bacterium]
MNEIILKGIPAAPGIAIGPAYILDKQELIVAPRSIMEQEIPIEIARFEEALIRTREEVATLQKKIADEMGSQHAQIFDAHLMALEDRSLIEDVVKGIRHQKQSAEYVFSHVLKKYAKVFANMEDEYLRDRITDVNDIGRRVLKNLVDEDKMHEMESLEDDLIIIAHDLSPSDTVNMFHKNILGFATDVGSRTSHTAIMAKSLGVPAVVGLKDTTLRISNQDQLIIDGRMGMIIVHPSEKTLEVYRVEQARVDTMRHRFDQVKELPAQTMDERQVKILANLELPEEIPQIKSQGAEGIGLYRTEYFYMNRADLPSEDEQYAAYRKVVEEMAPDPVTIRTLDIGGDKYLSTLQIPRDMYPFLGWRAVKFCFARPDIFKTQLRAILRAAAHGSLKVMFPMVAGPEDLRRAKVIMDEARQELEDKGVEHNADIPVGVMIEVPSAAMTADLLARDAAFFSIGTNDLIQYTLAVDRGNEQMADFYDPCHPAILRFIRMTIDAGHREEIPVSLCGEMASEPNFALLLLGLGLDEFSMNPLSILQIKQLIRSVKLTDAQLMAREALSMDDGKKIEKFCKARVKELAPDIFDTKELNNDAGRKEE